MAGYEIGNGNYAVLADTDGSNLNHSYKMFEDNYNKTAPICSGFLSEGKAVYRSLRPIALTPMIQRSMRKNYYG